MTTGTLIVAVLLIIIGIVMIVAGAIMYENRNNLATVTPAGTTVVAAPSTGWTWFLIIGGILLLLIGIAVAAWGYRTPAVHHDQTTVYSHAHPYADGPYAAPPVASYNPYATTMPYAGYP